MPAELTYPGVYIEELPSGVRPIVGVSTSTTAFVGRARKGPVDEAVLIHSFPEYARIFGGLWVDSRMSFAVRQYFQNGGSEAVIVRVTRGAATRAATSAKSFSGPGGALHIAASSPGLWGDSVSVAIDHLTADPATLFNITAVDADAENGSTETLRNLSVDPAAPSFVSTVLRQRSRLVRVEDGTTVPTQTPADSAAANLTGGADGGDIRDADVMPTSGRKGVRALDAVDIFNLLCLPPLTATTDVDSATFRDAASYLGETKRRAMLIVDPPATVVDPAECAELPGDADAAGRERRAVLPAAARRGPAAREPARGVRAVRRGRRRVSRAPTPTRGVWKAPAGHGGDQVDGASGLDATVLTDDENGVLNPLGVNCLRTFPADRHGRLGRAHAARRRRARRASGSTSRSGAPRCSSRRACTAGLKWVVFEPNDEPLWAQIRLNVGAFMHGLFRQGAFQGTTPREAYFVKCDAETTTQDDIDRGIVNIVVGFAPLKPAEFVVIQIQQIAGQIAT